MNESSIEAMKLGLTTIGMADNKAWICIAITMAVFAGTFSSVEKNLAKVSQALWILVHVAYLVMGVGVLIGVWVTFARGGVINAARGPGLVDPRRIHQWAEQDFVKKVEETAPEQFANEWNELAYDYSIIMNKKFFWLGICQIVSTTGWLLASISAVLVQSAARKQARAAEAANSESVAAEQPKVITCEKAVAISGASNGQATPRSPRPDQNVVENSTP